MKLIIITIAALIMSACFNHEVNDNNCSAACIRYRQLNCYEGKPTAVGKTCEEICVNALSMDAGGPHASCVVKALSCKEARQCWDDEKTK